MLTTWIFFIGVICLKFYGAAQNNLPTIPGSVEAYLYTDLNVKNKNGENIQNQPITDISTGDRVEYKVINNDEGYFTISYTIATSALEFEADELEISIVNGKDCKGPYTNKLYEEKFWAYNEYSTVDKTAKGYIYIPGEISTISVCFIKAKGVAFHRFNLNHADITPAITPAPTMSRTPATTPAPTSSPTPEIGIVTPSSSTTDELIENPEAPLVIEAETYYDYYDVFVDKGRDAEEGSIGELSGGEYAQYLVNIEKSGNFEFSVNLKGTPPSPIIIKMHFEKGETQCKYSEDMGYFPTVNLVDYEGSDEYETFVADNNVMKLDAGNQTVTLCFDDTSYVTMDSFLIQSSDKSVENPPEKSTGVFFNSTAWTLLAILGSGSAIAIAVFIVHRVFYVKSPAVPPKTAFSDAKSRMDAVEEDFSPSPFAGLEQQSSSVFR